MQPIDVECMKINEEFCEYCRTGQYQQVDEMLRSIPYVNFHYRSGVEGWTALHFAAAFGQLNIVYRLLEACFPIDVPDYNGRTAYEVSSPLPILRAVLNPIDPPPDVYGDASLISHITVPGAKLPCHESKNIIVKTIISEGVIKYRCVMLPPYCELEELKRLIRSYQVDYGEVVHVCRAFNKAILMNDNDVLQLRNYERVIAIYPKPGHGHRNYRREYQYEKRQNSNKNKRQSSVHVEEERPMVSIYNNLNTPMRRGTGDHKTPKGKRNFPNRNSDRRSLPGSDRQEANDYNGSRHYYPRTDSSHTNRYASQSPAVDVGHFTSKAFVDQPAAPASVAAEVANPPYRRRPSWASRDSRISPRASAQVSSSEDELRSESIGYDRRAEIPIIDQEILDFDNDVRTAGVFSDISEWEAETAISEDLQHALVLSLEEQHMATIRNTSYEEEASRRTQEIPVVVEEELEEIAEATEANAEALAEVFLNPEVTQEVAGALEQSGAQWTGAVVAAGILAGALVFARFLRN